MSFQLFYPVFHFRLGRHSHIITHARHTAAIGAEIDTRGRGVEKPAITVAKWCEANYNRARRYTIAVQWAKLLDGRAVVISISNYKLCETD